MSDEIVLASDSFIAGVTPCRFILRNFDDLFLFMSLMEASEEPEPLHAYDVWGLDADLEALTDLQKGQVVYRPDTEAAWRDWRFKTEAEVDAWLESGRMPFAL